MTNFRDAAASLVAIGAAEIVADPIALRSASMRLIDDEGARSRMAAAAARWHLENQGATARTIAEIAVCLES